MDHLSLFSKGDVNEAARKASGVCLKGEDLISEMLVEVLGRECGCISGECSVRERSLSSQPG